MTKSLLRALLAGGTALTLLAATSSASYADERSRSTAGDETAMKIRPGDVVAAAVGELGLTSFRDVFSGLRVEAGNRVTVYVTDTGRGTHLASSARGRISQAIGDQVQVQVKASKYTRAQLEAARSTLWSSSGPKEFHSIEVTHTGSGLVVSVDDPQGSAKRYQQNQPKLAGAVAATDVTFVAGQRPKPASREDDSAPYKGGIPIEGYWDSDWRCTSAFGIRQNNKTYLVTAEHCFDVGDWVYDRNDDYLGSVSFENNYRDAAAIDTSAGSGVWIDDTQTRVYQGYAWSWNGQYVCQSGFTSDKRCTIEVTADNIEWDYDDGKGARRGVAGRIGAGVRAVCGGDSGGPLWAYSSSGVFQSRGIVSGGYTVLSESNPRCYENILWTETPGVLSDLGATLITN